MQRRQFTFAVLSLLFLGAKSKNYKARIRTKSGSIIDNVVVSATDEFAAAAKVKDRYPGCEILSIQEK